MRKTYIIKTTYRNIFGEISQIRHSKEYKSLAIARRYMKEKLEQTIIERTSWVDRNYKRHFRDVELPNKEETL